MSKEWQGGEHPIEKIMKDIATNVIFSAEGRVESGFEKLKPLYETKERMFNSEVMTARNKHSKEMSAFIGEYAKSRNPYTAPKTVKEFVKGK